MGCSLEKKIKEKGFNAFIKGFEARLDVIPLDDVFEELGVVAQKIRDMLFLTRVRCQNCAESDEQYCEICAKKILGLIVEGEK